VGVSLDLDVRAAIRHPDLGRLVQAVVDADEHDEADWIEWKSTLDLKTKQGCFPIARTILGMANRMPASAELTCEGLGYMIVGAEPRNVAGVTSVDPADLDQILEPWLGGPEGPRYTSNYVPKDGNKVLVVTVEAPKNGDPVYMLHKQFDGARDGDVFVRKAGRTERANSVDLKALHARMLASPAATPELAVSLVGDVPLSWFEASSANAVIASWVSDRRGALESAARAEERRRHPESAPIPPVSGTAVGGAAGALAAIAEQRAHLERIALDAKGLGALSGILGEQDTRTLDQYLHEVEQWAERATEAAPTVLASRYLDARHGLVAVRVHNPSGRYLPKVRVEVHFEWEPLGSAEPNYDEEHFPAPPLPYGEAKPSPIVGSLGLRDFDYTIPRMPRIRPPERSWIEKGSVRIVFDVGDLRQEGTETSDRHHLLLPERPPDGILHGMWRATVREVHGVMRGTLDVPVHEEPVDLRDVLDNEPEARDDEDE
jgi:hypothetical protein